MADSTVHFIAPWFEYYPILCDALRLQTYPHWTLDLIHDGPETIARQGEWRNDPRVWTRCTNVRHNDWGHSLRADALACVPEAADYVVVSNADNYYAPIFLEIMLNAVKNADGAYCDMVHSHLKWDVLPAQLRLNHIDCGCLLIRRARAVGAGWRSREFTADWTWIEDMLKRGARLNHVAKPLFCHN